MSIATEIQELTQNTAELDGIRTDIRTALAGKGVSASDHNYADFAADISSIPSGGGGSRDEKFVAVGAKFEMTINAYTGGI